MNEERPRSSNFRKAAVAMAGGVVLAAGLVMMVTPGPGLVVSAAGLAILATEFKWAEKRLKTVRDRLRRLKR